jgi:putative hydrolase of the HAD superfamily
VSDTAIWFDLDGTLLALGDYGVILERACESVGIDGEQRTTFVETYQDRFFESLQELAEKPYTNAAEDGIDAVEVDPDPEAFVEALLEAECARTRVPESVEETLVDLGADHQLGVLTNGVTEWQRAKLDHHGLTDRVDAVVVSEEAGAHKPDAAPFELAADRLPADERWMIGDDREADVSGARAVGWNGVHVAEPEDLPSVVERIRS